MTDKEKILAFLEGMSKGHCPKETKEIIINKIIPWIKDLPEEPVNNLSVGHCFDWYDTRYSKPKCDCHILLASEDFSTFEAAIYNYATDKVYTNVAPDGEVLEWRELGSWAYDKYCPIKKIEEK